MTFSFNITLDKRVHMQYLPVSLVFQEIHIDFKFRIQLTSALAPHADDTIGKKQHVYVGKQK